MENTHDKHKKQILCPTKTCEDITISVPVEVHARAQIGDIILKCKGQHINPHGKPQMTSKFDIVHDISLGIPIDFITDVEVKNERVDFDLHKC